MEYNLIYYTDNYNTFDEWLNIVKNNEETVYPFARIPYDEWVEDYIDNIADKSVEEVKNLLRCLLVPINRKLDLSSYENYKLMKKSNIPEHVEMANKIYKNEMYKRIEQGQDAWEGLTWVLELLPSSPYNAIRALESYLFAQHNLPDDRITGIEQCAEIIMAKFIYFENELEKLTSLKAVEFEWLIEQLYEDMGYQTAWTPCTRDGGKDIIATIARTDGIERVYIECKLYKTTKLKVETVRAFIYVLEDNKINRGVIFCTGYVSDNIKNMDNRVQIWTYEEINVLLNAHLGSDWVNRLHILIENKRRKYKKSMGFKKRL